MGDETSQGSHLVISIVAELAENVEHAQIGIGDTQQTEGNRNSSVARTMALKKEREG